ncbi:hypothetical protein ACIOWG_28400 [Streptomyces sp. NPDC087658]|uniref:hypothetical protein n=1 Tax=Streptomyces sp. NPDC087658 TaxID=3365800 RepID=UPI00380B5200
MADAFEDGRQVARVLGHLVQRGIGHGLRRQGNADSGAAPMVREPAVTDWSPPAVTAMAGALDRAVR